MAKKKTASRNQTASTRKTARKSTAGKKSAVKRPAEKTARKTAGGKTAKKRPAKKEAPRKTPAAKKAKKKNPLPKASELSRKRVSHTPAVFKTSNKKPTAIFFTMEDLREVLKKRASEEARERVSANPIQAARKGVEVEKKDLEAPRKSKHAAASLDDILGLSGGTGGNPSMSGGENVPRKWKKYYNLLIELRNEVQTELNLHSNDTLKRSQKEDSGDIAISVDAGSDNFDRDFALSLLSSEQEALNEIKAAINRIHKGTYGICEVTGDPIKPDRLEAVPFTRFSVEGQKQYEMNMRKRVSRTGAFLSEASGEKITFGEDDGDN